MSKTQPVLSFCACAVLCANMKGWRQRGWEGFGEGLVPARSRVAERASAIEASDRVTARLASRLGLPDRGAVTELVTRSVFIRPAIPTRYTNRSVRFAQSYDARFSCNAMALALVTQCYCITTQINSITVGRQQPLGDCTQRASRYSEARLQLNIEARRCQRRDESEREALRRSPDSSCTIILRQGN